MPEPPAVSPQTGESRVIGDPPGVTSSLGAASQNGRVDVHGLQRYLVEEIAEEYQHGRLSRRELLRRVTLMTGSAAVGASILAGLRPAPAMAAPAPRPAQQAGITVSPTDPDIDAGQVQWPGNDVRLSGYLAQPRSGAPHPGVLVVHENRGLQEHNSDVCRRLAKNGYAGLVVDLL